MRFDQRARQPHPMVGRATCILSVLAHEARLGGMAAAAGDGRHQHEARRIGDPMIDPRDRNRAGFQRLPQRIEHARPELRQLAEEQHPVMGERDFSGPHPQSAVHQRRHAGRMMRAAKRPPVGERPAFDLARHPSHHRDFEQFGRGRPDQQQVLAAGRRDLERPLGALLALDVLEIDGSFLRRANLRLRLRQQLAAAGMIGEPDERAGRDDLPSR
jgi:hypothetical protein